MSIADKLTTIAENEQKIYNKGGLDVSPQESVSGEAICITDISPIEHNMAVSVSGVEDLSTVKLYKGGKNLYKLDIANMSNAYPHLGEATLIEKTENGAIVQGKVYASGGGDSSWYNGWFQPYKNGSTSSVYLRKGDKVTVSADVTWLDITNYKAGEKLGCYLNKQNTDSNNAAVFLNKSPTSADVGITYRVKATHTIKTTDGYYIPIFTLNSCKMKIENIQISFDGDTEYEPYIESTVYDVSADGTVEGVKSIYPNTTLYTDTEGVVIDCTYYQDGKKVKENLTDLMLSPRGATGEVIEK